MGTNFHQTMHRCRCTIDAVKVQMGNLSRCLRETGNSDLAMKMSNWAFELEQASETIADAYTADLNETLQSSVNQTGAILGALVGIKDKP